MDVSWFLEKAIHWAKSQPGLVALALAGSHARGEARPDSDVDLVLLVRDPQAYLDDTAWIAEFGQPLRQQVEDYGKVVSLRVWYADGLEVEFGLTDPAWGSDPAEEGDARVIRDGIRVLFDRDGRFSTGLAAFLPS